jgi:hypothetical protein
MRLVHSRSCFTVILAAPSSETRPYLDPFSQPSGEPLIYRDAPALLALLSATHLATRGRLRGRLWEFSGHGPWRAGGRCFR